MPNITRNNEMILTDDTGEFCCENNLLCHYIETPLGDYKCSRFHFVFLERIKTTFDKPVGHRLIPVRCQKCIDTFGMPPGKEDSK
jgi:hypothetical protein